VHHSPAAVGNHLLLYDGVCGLCSRVLQFVLAHDRRGVFSSLPGAAHRRGMTQDIDPSGERPHTNAPETPTGSIARSDSSLLMRRSCSGRGRALGSNLESGCLRGTYRLTSGFGAQGIGAPTPGIHPSFPEIVLLLLTLRKPLGQPLPQTQ